MVVQHLGRSFEHRAAINGADLAQFLGDDQVWLQCTQQVAVDPIQRVGIGPGLADDGVDLFAGKVGDLTHALADHRLGCGVIGVITGVRDAHQLVSQSQGVDDFRGTW